MSPSNITMVRFSFWITRDTKSFLPVALRTRSPTTKRLAIFSVVLRVFIVTNGTSFIKNSFNSLNLRPQVLNCHKFSLGTIFSISHCFCKVIKTLQIIKQLMLWNLFNRIHAFSIGTFCIKSNKKSRCYQRLYE